MRYKTSIEIAGRAISANSPAYFIADIAANHDGDLERAKALIYRAKEAGADAAKFQHFQAETIVSDTGFRSLGNQLSHQAKWKKSVYQVYEEASLKLDWTPVLAETCRHAGISFFTSPYSLDLVDHVDPFVPAYKIGSGDITWLEAVEYIARKNKPVLLATGASHLQEVTRAVDAVLQHNADFVLMQCNTNYTASHDNFKYINLNVLKTYGALYPGMILGLSDHTPRHATVLGAIALGARVIEKHFTDDNEREGPDHKFSMNPASWREMVERSRELELALGDGVKRVETNEADTVLVQRRSLCLTRNLELGHRLATGDLICLRPCPEGALEPSALSQVIGRAVRKDKRAGESLYLADLADAQY